MAQPLSALVFGEILWDIIEGEKYIGGAPLNFAAHFVKCGGSASMISGVGDDELGSLALNYVKKLDVNTAAVYLNRTKPTATVDVFLKDGQPDYTIHEDVAFDFIPTSVTSDIATGEYDIFYFGTLAQRHDVSRITLHSILEQRKFNHIFYDINIRKNFYSAAIVRYGLKHCTVFKINDDEVKIVSQLFYHQDLSFEEFSRHVAKEYDVTTIIITAGDKGCYIFSQDKLLHVTAEKIVVADTVGAGDSFSAAFMHQLGSGKSALEAAAFGNQVGGFVASSKGPIPEYSDAIKAILKTSL